MPEGHVLEFSGVTKRFGAITAVSDLTARVEPGLVTGFLGPNGAGKTTTLRVLLGLVRATSGTATIGGRAYAKLDRPLQTVGAVLEASSFHPGRTAANHLTVYAQAAGIPRSRVDEVLGLVGLADAAGRKVGGFSLGMRQRLGLAYALVGDPGVLVLDEPANGLDPEGIKWMRGFLRQLAREGRTVLTSSHLLAEVQQTVDSLLVISQGRLVFQGQLEELTDPSEYATVVDGPDRNALVAALSAAGVSFEVLRSGLTVRGLEPVRVGEIAAAAGIPLSSLHKRGPALEEVFLDLVNGTRVHPSSGSPAVLGGAVAAAAAAGAAADAIEETDAAPSADASPEVVDEETDAAPAAAEAAIAAPAAAEAPVAAAAFAVASTGVIDIVAGEDEEAVDADETGEVDVEELAVASAIAEAGDPEDEVQEDPPLAEVDEDGAGDEELAGTEASDPDRPWEEYVKTESDIEADAFFSSFDAAAAAAAARESAAAGQAAEPESETGHEPLPDSEPEPESEREPEPESGSEPESEPEPETEPEEPSTGTSEFGGLSDLSPDWVEEDRTEIHEGGDER